MRAREVYVRAERIGTSHSDRKRRTYPADRHCEVCDAPLSKYNPSDKSPHRCWLHRLHVKQRVRGKVA